MAEYHVGCGLAGIYAGTLKTNGEEWRNKTDATHEALYAVAQFLIFQGKMRIEEMRGGEDGTT